MENAFEALKMAFAVIVFVIALAIAFSLLTQANATARQIFFGMDTVTYLDNTRVAGSESKGHRIVGLETIIPTIYRYSVENCGVTIIDKEGNIIARYDLETENVASNIGNFKTYNEHINDAELKYKAPIYVMANSNYRKHMDYLVKLLKLLQNRLDEEAKEGETHFKIKCLEGVNDSYTETNPDGSEQKFEFSDTLDEKLQQLYFYTIYDGHGKYGEYWGAPWGSNFVAKRLETDLYGGEILATPGVENGFTNNDFGCVFGNQVYGPFSKNLTIRNKIDSDYEAESEFQGGLVNALDGKKFAEYIIEEEPDYIIRKYQDKFGGDTESDETSEDTDMPKSKKLEIFYIEQE